MERMTRAPLVYIQEDGCLNNIGAYAAGLGSGGVYAIADPFVLQTYGGVLSGSFSSRGISWEPRPVDGECCMEQIERMIGELRGRGCKVVAGIGGGKALDLAKAVAHFSELPVLVVPTAASTDAPCSSISVLYTEDGQLERYLSLRRSPDVVMADTRVIANAPARLLASGMGDAMATYYEALSCYRRGWRTNAGGRCSLAALSLAATCRDTLFADGYEAYCSAQEKKVTPALENIVEANIYLSGIGFESGGLSVAHAVHNGLSVLGECRGKMHGEKVAFGTLVQLCLEEDEEEFDRVLAFHRKIGLPVCLEELGIKQPDERHLLPAAGLACRSGGVMGNIPEEVTPECLCRAMLSTDRMARERR